MLSDFTVQVGQNSALRLTFIKKRNSSFDYSWRTFIRALQQIKYWCKKGNSHQTVKTVIAQTGSIASQPNWTQNKVAIIHQ